MKNPKIKYYIFAPMQLLRKIAFPISLIYGLVVYLRNWLYDQGLFKSQKFNTPTVCIGNLSVGGTGKTPMIEWLIRELQEDHQLAVLSRGYRRKTYGFMQANRHSTAADIGDEPLQISRKFPGVVVAVDADRAHGIKALELQVAPEIILLDDAFQHRRVSTDLSLLLTAYDQLYADDWFLPTGNLRDSRKEARRADFIIVTKCPKDLSDAEKSAITRKLKPTASQQVLFCYLEYSDTLTSRNQTCELSELRDTKISLVTGIARPEPLLNYLRSQGINFEHLQFRDHHFFSEKEIDLFKEKSFVMTTEKDYVRASGQIDQLYYIEVRHRFMDEGAAVLRRRLRQSGS